jgi:hypothetical protein
MERLIEQMNVKEYLESHILWACGVFVLSRGTKNVN